MATLFRQSGRSTWTIGLYPPASGNVKPRRVKIATGLKDRQSAMRLLALVEDLAELAALGRPPVGELRQRVDALPDRMIKRLVTCGLLSRNFKAIDELIDEYEQELAGRGNTRAYVEQETNRIRRVIRAGRIESAAEITPHRVRDALHRISSTKPKRKKGRPHRRAVTGRTLGRYQKSIQGLTRWLARPSIGVLSVNPLAELSPIKATPRRRWALSVDDAKRLLTEVERDSAVNCFGIEPADRAIAYRLALETGLRAAELRSLTAGSFEVDAAGGTVTVEAGYSKNRKRAVLPLRADTARRVAAHLSTKLAGARAVALPCRTSMARMLRADAQRAGVATDRGPDYLKLDFHCLRHTCGSWLASAGVHPKVIQTILRHHDVSLTMNTYGHLFMGDEAAAVAKLPVLDAGDPQAVAGGGA